MLPRGRQSQQPARVSRVNPLARGTVSLLNFGIKGVPDGVNGRLSTVVGTRTGVLRTGTRATGFGATSGAGTTDSVTSRLTAHATLRTYIAAVYVTGANSSGSLGRLFDKRTAAAATQVEVLFADQNTAATNNFNFARAHSVSQGAWSTPIGSVAPNTLQIVHVVYDSGSTANDPAIYINGGAQVVTEITAPVGTPTNNAAQYVWGNRTDDNARCLPGFLMFGQVLDRLMSADEVAESTRDLWQMFAPVAQSLRTNAPSGPAVALTGASAAFSQASVIPSLTVALTGPSAAFSAGTLAPSVSLTLTGASAAFSAGNVLPGLSVALTGPSAAFSTGNVDPGGSPTLTGNTANFSQANITPFLTLALTGPSAAFSVGTLTPSLDNSAALTGATANFSQASVTPNLTVALTGVSAAFSAGDVQVASGDITVPLTGASAAFSAGTLTAEVASGRSQWMRAFVVRELQAFYDKRDKKRAEKEVAQTIERAAAEKAATAQATLRVIAPTQDRALTAAAERSVPAPGPALRKRPAKAPAEQAKEFLSEQISRALAKAPLRADIDAPAPPPVAKADPYEDDDLILLAHVL